jgi:alanyl-tRNA synthetase
MFAAVPAKVQTVVRYKESAITGGGVGSGPRFEIDVEKDYPGDVFGRLGIPLPPFPAKSAFELYDTFGFPLDLTELMARERGLTVDVAGFEKLMEEQRRRAREDHAKKKSVITVAGEGLQVEPTKFLGYDNLEAEVVVEAVQPGVAGSFEIIVDQTPFYAEMGGQVGDTGLVHVPGHDRDEIGRLTVLDTQKQGDVHVHKCKLLPYPESGGATVPVAGETAASQRLAPPKVWRAPEIGEAVRVAVDAGRRANIQRHHTVTHLFHWALHEVVSKDARQRGSLVAPDRLRFDFNHPERLTEQQIADIERLVNARVHENAPVFWFELPYHEVKDNPKIMQFFGDKYGNIVRIVQIGGHLDGLDGFSMELCGGTHTRTTGEIGLFKIAKESAISAGVRRIEAACGQFALEFIERTKSAAQAEAEREKARELEKVLQRQLKAETVKRAAVLAELALAKTQEHAGIPMIVDDLGEANAGFLRVVADALKPHVTSGVVVLGGVRDDKVSLLCYVTPDLVKAGHHAGKIVGELAKICGGGGGGKPDLAQAGGKQPDRLPEALAAARRLITG